MIDEAIKSYLNKNKFPEFHLKAVFFDMDGVLFIDLEKLELGLPFTERVIYPIARKLGELTMRFTPQNWLSSISRKLELSGRPSRLDPARFRMIAAIRRSISRKS